MEMNETNGHIPVSEGVKHVAKKPESSPSATLGTPNFYGAKLSVNMTPEDKKELLMRLAEWRKARKEKLGASILAKQKQVDKAKASTPSLPLESKPVPQGGTVNSEPQLFDKMMIEPGKRSKAKLDKGLDPKNIFKSTIIEFALQQNAVKNVGSEIEEGVRQQLYIATPVRRSTRLRTPLNSTDEVPSLQTLTPELRENVTFKPNESLLSGD